jgi:hypothetical protein
MGQPWRVAVHLGFQDGSGVQLGNSGGNVVLQDNSGNQVDSVTYGVQGAGPPSRFVPFRR